MPNVSLPPVLLDTLALAGPASISEAEMTFAAKEVERSLFEAGQAIDLALQHVQEAEQRQLEIHRRNEEYAKLPAWRRPSGWEAHRSSAGAYRGFTKLGSDGVRYPHGEGQSSHANVTYRCANFEFGAVRGHFVEGYADGSVMSGYLDDTQGIGDIRRNDAETGCTYVGRWTTVGGWTSLHLGAIEYPDGSIYRGYCGRVEELQRVWPDGYGAWEFAEHSIAVRCRFEHGFAHGVAILSTNGRLFGGRFDRGRLTGIASL